MHLATPVDTYMASKELSQAEAATKVQARIRGKQSRSAFTKFLYAPVDLAKAVGTGLQAAGDSIVHGTVAAGEAIGSATAAAGEVIGTATVAAGAAVGGIFTGSSEAEAGGARRSSGPLSDEEVEKATAPERWFTPEHGWQCEDLDGNAPHLCMPTAASAKAIFPTADEAIGELCVEVLEARGLPNTDHGLFGNMTDPYAFVVFEGSGVRTSVVRDSLNPRWGATDRDSFRAFKFRVVKPYSVLYVCINDFDGGVKHEKASAAAMKANEEASALSREGSGKHVNASTSKRKESMFSDSDDHIGRVAISLGRLIGGSEYDCWFALGYGNIDPQNAEEYGAVRLRFSVTFKSERARMLGYLGQPPTHLVPFKRARHRRNAIFAKQGGVARHQYDWDVLMKYVDELKVVAKLAVMLVAAIENVLLWRCHAIGYSVVSFVGFQLLVSYPHYFPVSWGVGLLLILLATYSVPAEDPRLEEEVHARPASHSHRLPSPASHSNRLPSPASYSQVHARPSLVDLVAALAIDRKPQPLEYSPSQATCAVRGAAPGAAPPMPAKPSSKSLAEGSLPPESLDGAGRIIAKQFRDAAVDYWQEKVLGHASGESKEETLGHHLALIEEEVAQFIDEGDDTEQEKIEKKQARSQKAHGGKSLLAAFNPMATALGPVQSTLADLLPAVRAVRYLIFWNDRILTFWLVAAIIVGIGALALIPWFFVLYWAARILGIALLGPHMHLVGRWLDKQRAEQRAKASAASPSESL